MGAKLLLLPLTPLYGGGVRLRAAAYRRGLLKTIRLPAPVVSVGNLTFGGTGKTPTVLALARDLARRGRRPAVLTRGYRRRGSKPLVLIGPEAGATAEAAGDEPLEMARRLPGVPVIVDADRARGGREALRLGADVLLLDDGFQHLTLARDLNLLLIDAGNPWGGGRLPPRGKLREPVAAVRRADAVLVTKLGESGKTFDAVVADIRRLAPDMPVLGSRLAPGRWLTAAGPRPVNELAGRRVFAFAGIARPGGFVEVLRALGAEVVGTRWFDDHHRYRASDLRRLAAEAEGLGAVPVTTSKDAVKLPADGPQWVLEVDVVPVNDGWDALWALAAGVLP